MSHTYSKGDPVRATRSITDFSRVQVPEGTVGTFVDLTTVASASRGNLVLVEFPGYNGDGPNGEVKAWERTEIAPAAKAETEIVEVHEPWNLEPGDVVETAPADHRDRAAVTVRRAGKKVALPTSLGSRIALTFKGLTGTDRRKLILAHNPQAGETGWWRYEENDKPARGWFSTKGLETGLTGPYRLYHNLEVLDDTGVFG